MNTKLDCYALVVFLGPENGGRSKPPQSGYHPQLQVGNQKTSCAILSVEPENNCFAFGVEYRVGMRLMFPDRYRAQLNAGFKVRLFEGSKLVGEGTIVEMV